MVPPPFFMRNTLALAGHAPVQFGVEVAQTTFLFAPQWPLEAARVGALLDDGEKIAVLIEHFAKAGWFAKLCVNHLGPGAARQVHFRPQAHPGGRAISRRIDMAIEDAGVISELVGIGCMRDEAVQEDRFRMAADLHIREDRLNDRVRKLAVAEPVKAQAQFI